jgi:GDPmannose 4,6-dehydratase
MSFKRAFITGITGQDGSYLAELLLGMGYEVFGLMRRSSTFSTDRIEHLYRDPHESGARLHLLYGDITDPLSLTHALQAVQPDEVYHLAAQSHVKVSFEQPMYTLAAGAHGTAALLEAVRQLAKRPRVFHASSSEMFGQSKQQPQDENTPFQPVSPYACAKVCAHHLVVMYRQAFGLFACNGILFNHESPRRGETFVTRKITRAATRIKLGLQEKLHLGNLEARRDWGYAGDTVEAMWRMLQADEPDDWAVATGVSHAVSDWLESAFGWLDLDWRQYVELDPRYLRPNEVSQLVGDSTKIRSRLGWQPATSYAALVAAMVDSDLALAQTEAGRG